MNEELIERLNSLYGEIYEISIMIGQLIDRKQYNGINNFLDIKENLFVETEGLLKEIGDSPQLAQFGEICEKIKEQEAMNINTLTQNRDEIKKQIAQNNKKVKLANAYNNIETKQGNLLDFKQ